MPSIVHAQFKFMLGCCKHIRPSQFLILIIRCGKENSRFNELINTDPDRACSVAMFIGELLMNYKVCYKYMKQ